MNGAYQDELKSLSRYFRMEDEYPDLYQSWQEMIEKLYHEEQTYFCTVRQGHLKGRLKILAKNINYFENLLILINHSLLLSIKIFVYSHKRFREQQIINKSTSGYQVLCNHCM